jgi:chromosome segregation ATPase
MSTQFIQVSNENKRLVEQINTSVSLNSENHFLRMKVTELDAKFERLKTTPAQQEVEKYRQFYLQEEQERAKYQTGLSAARRRIEKMEYEIEVLNHRLTSPYMQEQRGMWKGYTIFLSFLLGCSLLAIIWLVFFA